MNYKPPQDIGLPQASSRIFRTVVLSKARRKGVPNAVAAVSIRLFTQVLVAAFLVGCGHARHSPAKAPESKMPQELHLTPERKEVSLTSGGVKISIAVESGAREPVIERIGYGIPIAFPAGYRMSSIEASGQRWSLEDGRVLGEDDRDRMNVWELVYLWPGMAEHVRISQRCPSGIYHVAVAPGDVKTEYLGRGECRIWTGSVSMKTPW